MVIERYYHSHNEWCELSNPTSILRLLKKDVESKGYVYYKPINGYKYRSKVMAKTIDELIDDMQDEVGMCFADCVEDNREVVERYFKMYLQSVVEEVTEKQLRKLAKKSCNGHQHAMRYGNMLNSCFEMGKLVKQSILNLREEV